MTQNIKNDLVKHLEICLPNHHFKKVLEYATLPPGKLFRPQLVLAIAKDLGELTNGHKFLASSIEIHHAYSLVHDDLPSMDDDDYRRGKLSTHKNFNEALAILAGDALLNYSYEILSNINSKFLPELLKLYGEMTGSRGLILGQVMDLDDTEKNLDDILTIHSLKTSCLIQLALQGSNLLSGSKLNKEEVMKLGFTLGIVFQLIDDLSELGDKINSHEKSINPFLKFEQSTVLNKLTDYITIMHEIICTHNLINLKKVIDNYLLKMKNNIEDNKASISKNVNDIEVIFTLI